MNYRDLSLSLAEALVRAQADAGERHPAGSGQTPPPFTVTISREAGAQGSSVAVEVGRRLGWPVYDRNILDKIAEQFHHLPSRLEEVDERPSTWLGECISSLLDRYHVASDAYLRHLFAVVRGLGLGGRCVIVGRGANFILPAETTLSVRLVALEKDRAETVARRLGLSTKEADAWVRATERERAAFGQRAFGQNPASPHHYDLVLNLSRLSAGGAAAVITEALRSREGRGAQVGQQQQTPAERVGEKATAENPAFA